MDHDLNHGPLLDPDLDTLDNGVRSRPQLGRNCPAIIWAALV